MKTETPETDAFLVKMSARKRQWETVSDWAEAHNATLEHARKLERERNAAFEILRGIVQKDEEAIKELAAMMDDYEPEQGCLEIHARINALLGENA